MIGEDLSSRAKLRGGEMISKIKGLPVIARSVAERSDEAIPLFYRKITGLLHSAVASLAMTGA